MLFFVSYLCFSCSFNVLADFIPEPEFVFIPPPEPEPIFIPAPEPEPILVIEEVVPSLCTIVLTWDFPYSREDGSDLALYEIKGYDIKYRLKGTFDYTNILVDYMVTSYEIQFLECSGNTYEFAIATMDIDNLTGEYSDIIEQAFE